MIDLGKQGQLGGQVRNRGASLLGSGTPNGHVVPSLSSPCPLITAVSPLVAQSTIPEALPKVSKNQASGEVAITTPICENENGADIDRVGPRNPKCEVGAVATVWYGAGFGYCLAERHYCQTPFGTTKGQERTKRDPVSGILGRPRSLVAPATQRNIPAGPSTRGRSRGGFYHRPLAPRSRAMAAASRREPRCADAAVAILLVAASRRSRPRVDRADSRGSGSTRRGACNLRLRDSQDPRRVRSVRGAIPYAGRTPRD